MIELVKADEAMALADAEPCMAVPDVKAVYDQQKDLAEKAAADPDKKNIIIKEAALHAKKIKANAKDFVALWDAGKFYEAGQKVGEVDAIVFKHWMDSASFLQ